MAYEENDLDQIDWRKVADKACLQKFISLLENQIECSPSMILNTLGEIQRSLDFALMKTGTSTQYNRSLVHCPYIYVVIKLLLNIFCLSSHHTR